MTSLMLASAPELVCSSVSHQVALVLITAVRRSRSSITARWSRQALTYSNFTSWIYSHSIQRYYVSCWNYPTVQKLPQLDNQNTWLRQRDLRHHDHRHTDWSWHFLASPVLSRVSLIWTSSSPVVSHKHTDTTRLILVTLAMTTRCATSCVKRLVACMDHVSPTAHILVSRAGIAWAGNSMNTDLNFQQNNLALEQICWYYDKC